LALGPKHAKADLQDYKARLTQVEVNVATLRALTEVPPCTGNPKS
jgi:hypothetical protein